MCVRAFVAVALFFGWTCAAWSAHAAATDSKEMAIIPAGEFVYGDNQGEADERPARRLNLPAFAIDRTEVTVAAYATCVTAKRCPAADGKQQSEASLPVVGVSFHAAAAYCAFVEKRLPTETEWEKAARGTDGRRYPWGDNFDCSRGNFGTYGGDGRCAEDGAPGKPLPVGGFAAGASPYGVLDMAGNVWEWVDSRYDYRPLLQAAEQQSDQRSEPRKEKREERPELRVVRGGGCCSIFGLPRSSDRLPLPSTYRDVDIGFRCARSVPVPPAPPAPSLRPN